MPRGRCSTSRSDRALTPARGASRASGANILRKCLELLAVHRWLKLTIVSLFVINGVLSLMTNIYWLVSDYVYAKDFIQEYLLAMAIVRGDNPYLPIDQLSQLYIWEIYRRPRSRSIIRRRIRRRLG